MKCTLNQIFYNMCMSRTQFGTQNFHYEIVHIQHHEDLREAGRECKADTLWDQGKPLTWCNGHKARQYIKSCGKVVDTQVNYYECTERDWLFVANRGCYSVRVSDNFTKGSKVSLYNQHYQQIELLKVHNEREHACRE